MRFDLAGLLAAKSSRRRHHHDHPWMMWSSISIASLVPWFPVGRALPYRRRVGSSSARCLSLVGVPVPVRDPVWPPVPAHLTSAPGHRISQPSLVRTSSLLVVVVVLQTKREQFENRKNHKTTIHTRWGWERPVTEAESAESDGVHLDGSIFFFGVRSRSIAAAVVHWHNDKDALFCPSLAVVCERDNTFGPGPDVVGFPFFFLSKNLQPPQRVLVRLLRTPAKLQPFSSRAVWSSFLFVAVCY